MTDIRIPDDCETMADVRAGVDHTDRELMELLDRRFGYMRAAARIKPDRSSVRDEDRKAEVVQNAKVDAEGRDLPADQMADIWDRLVEISIAYEMKVWDSTRR